jgi:hypothetical protein
MDEEGWIAAPARKRRGNGEDCWEGLTIRVTEKGLGIYQAPSTRIDASIWRN